MKYRLDLLIKGFRNEPQDVLSEKSKERGGILRINLPTTDELFGAKTDKAQ